MKILIFQRTLPHYRLNVFRELYKTTGAILCFGKNGPSGTFLTKITPDFEHLKVQDIYPLKEKDAFVIQDIFSPLLRYRPDVIISEFALPIVSNWILLILRPFLKFKLILWTHGYNRRVGFNPEKSFIDKLRAWFMNKADAIIIYSNQRKIVISKYIKRPEKIFVAANTLDTRELTGLRKHMEAVGKRNIKRELGFNERYNLIYTGRILKEKEPARLVEVFRIITSELDSIELHFVGEGPLMEQIKNITHGLKVRFWGNIIDDYEIAKLLFASDLMVMPGYLGLSVVHAFCFDKPVVSQRGGSSGPFHSPEAEYVIDGKTGFLVEYGQDKLMAGTIIQYLKDEKKQLRMKSEVRAMVENTCSFNNMLDGFREALAYVYKNK